MDNKYNLKFNGVFTHNNNIVYEIENSKGEKVYFLHKGHNYIYLKADDEDVRTVDNGIVTEELITCHNQVVTTTLTTTGFEYRYIDVDGLLILLPHERVDEEIWKWIEA